jgi:hypothetical protein
MDSPKKSLRKALQNSGQLLEAVASDALAWNDALSEILKYSLLRRDPNASTLEVHRLVQVARRRPRPRDSRYLAIKPKTEADLTTDCAD